MQRAVRQYGWSRRYVSNQAGYNSRLDELQAAALLDCKLGWLDDANELRRKIAGLYTGLRGLLIETPAEKAGFRHVYHQYAIRNQS
jgi:dTDP-4-amino-4,6-dideoxygalactose transaminase